MSVEEKSELERNVKAFFSEVGGSETAAGSKLAVVGYTFTPDNVELENVNGIKWVAVKTKEGDLLSASKIVRLDTGLELPGFKKTERLISFMEKYKDKKIAVTKVTAMHGMNSLGEEYDSYKVQLKEVL